MQKWEAAHKFEDTPTVNLTVLTVSDQPNVSKSAILLKEKRVLVRKE